MSSDLNRFVIAQEPVYPRVLAELRTGRKTSHWMWFVFPQIIGLGRSKTAKFYAIHSPLEAKAYLEHPVLGVRLHECCRILLAFHNRSVHDIFGSPDDIKLKSCLTLFAVVAPGEPIFEQLLDKYYCGERDEQTIAILDEIDGRGPLYE